MIKGPVERFELPNLMRSTSSCTVRSRGRTISLKTDAQGKVFSTALLRMEIEVKKVTDRGSRPGRRRRFSPHTEPADKRNAIDTGHDRRTACRAGAGRSRCGRSRGAVRGAGSGLLPGMDLNELLASADRTPSKPPRPRSTSPRCSCAAEAAQTHSGTGAGRALAGLWLATAATYSGDGIPRGLDILRCSGLCAGDRHTMRRRAGEEKVAFDLAATGRLLDGIEAAASASCRASTRMPIQEQAAEVSVCWPKASPSALAFTKQHFYQLDGLSFDEGLRLGADVNAVSRSTPGLRAA